MIGDSWTHKIARFFVLPLVNTSITPNHITTSRLITGLIACSAFAIEMNLLGGILWLISTFLDRADGDNSVNSILEWIIKILKTATINNRE